MKLKTSGRVKLVLLFVFFYITASFIPALTVYADEPDYQAQAEERKNLPVQSNQIPDWPDGPEISAQSAILMEANTGVILYAKNIHERAYPASTTKIMTCLLATENAKMDELVTFSHDAVFGISRDSSNIGIDVGQAMSMEECLYGILVASANEVANAVAEHISGSQDDFAKLMNQKAMELGCENTHFVNAHGLYDDNHYTTAYDLALIAQAFFKSELLTKVGNTASYHFVATNEQPDDFIVRNKHKLITGEIAYNGIKGGKTGYTDEARQTLVTCAERNGMKLICVVMKEETPDQFNDTAKLFDYGFSNFSITNVSTYETDYQIDNPGFFHSSYDVFGNSKQILTLNPDSYLILPKTADFHELTSEVSYENLSENEVAEILYTYHDNYVGSANILLAKDTYIPSDDENAVYTEEGRKITFVNVKTIIFITLAVAALLIIIFVVRDVINNYTILDSGHGTVRKKRPKRVKRNRDKGPKFPSSRSKGFGL